MNEMVADEEVEEDEEEIESSWIRSFKSQVSILLSEDWPSYDRGRCGGCKRCDASFIHTGDTGSTSANLLLATILIHLLLGNAFPKIHNADTIMRDLFDTDSGLFYGQNVERVIDQFQDGRILNRIQLGQFRRALDIGYSCARRICSDVLHDDITHPFVKLDEYREDRSLRHGDWDR